MKKTKTVKLIPAPTPAQIREFCRLHYYTNNNELWEPFEYHDVDQVAEFIEADSRALSEFLGIKHTQLVVKWKK